MRIALVSEVFPPDTGWGGIGTYVHHMAHALSQAGHEVTVLCGYATTPYAQQASGIRILRWLNTRGMSAQERSAVIASILERAISTYSIEVVEFAEFAGDGYVFQRRNEGFPAVVKLHAPSRLCAVEGAPLLERALRQVLLRPSAAHVDRMERHSAACAHAVVSPSRWLLDTLRSKGWRFPDEPTVVPNPLLASPEPPVDDMRYNQQDVLLLGRLSRLKGADLYADIFRRVWQAMPNASFHVIGQDSLRSTHEPWSAYIARKLPPTRRSQVRFQGGVPHADVRAHLLSHSIAIFASRFENFPYALLECMDAGIACVVGAPGGAQEVGQQCISAVNVPRNAETIADTTVRLLADPSFRSSVGSAARIRVNEFRPHAIVPQMHQVYQNAIRRAQRSPGTPAIDTPYHSR